MKTKVLQVFYNENGLPFKDQERTVHYPIVGNGFQGANNTTQIKFYFSSLGDSSVTWVAVSKLPNGKVGSRVLESHLDSELNEHYALLELDNYYTQYKGDVFISLQGYQGGVDFDYDEENSQYEIHGTPTIAATGSIKFTINYANQFVGSGETDNINFQRILAALGTKLGMRAYSEHVEELPSEGSPDVFYVVNDDPNDPNLSNIYIWNENTRHYIWVGDNTLDLGDYYTKQEGQAFETQVENHVDAIENQVQQVASGSPKGVYSTLSDLETAYPTGAEGIYVVSSNGHWYYWSGSAWTDGGVYQTAVNYDELENNIESLKSSFFKLAISSWEPGIINYDGSILSSLTGWRTSGYIECNTRFLTIKGELNGFSSAGYRYLYCYDKDKKPIRELLLSQETPLVYEDYTNIRLCPNTAYIKVCCGASNIDDFELFVNPKLEIETYNKTYKKYFNIPNDTSYEGYIEVDGSFNSFSGYFTSDYIEVTKNHIYFEGYLSGLTGYNYINCYDEEKNFISGLGTTQVSCDTLTKIDLPANTRYIRLTGNYYNYAGNLIYNTYDERFKLISPDDNEEPEDKIMDDNFYAFRKFGVIGDSLSVGHMYNEYTQQQVGENLEYSWSYFLARKCGSQAICFGFSGATTKTFWENNRQLLTQEGNKCQCYILCLGVNDRDTIGSLSDIDWNDYNNNQDTFYGRYARIIQYLKQINPLAPVFCFNMPNPYGSIFPDINTAIDNIVNDTPLNGVYLVDLTQYNADFGKVNDTEFFNYHYTPMGYNAIAKINQKALSKVMLDNSEDFRSIAFIPLN